ncbi:MAG: ABC transporter permease [Candidatus Tectomicrobia bacterium]|uniref:ABC transporter permease n=1 Tax=Tectimicrobiota bacterium TaxID=2528274 RepID=A0A932HZE0_UNCTE|nr:ABC transporter permease [Candidatus Tectomicrobia bacterium]
MRAFIIRRIGQSVLVCLGVAVVTFLLLRIAHDPVYVLLPPESTKEEIETLRKAMGFDQPLPVQFAFFMGRLLQGDFGDSFVMAQPASQLIWERMPATLELSLAGMAIALAVAIPLGVFAAFRRNTLIDTFCTSFAVSGQAMPIFWFGIMLIIIFAVQLKVLPVSGSGTYLHLILPAVTLSLNLAPIIMRLTRSRMLDVLNQDYIRTARSKGVLERGVLFRHALRNAAISVVTIIGLQFGRLMGGAVVTETVFAWPGVATLVVSSIYNADFPVVQAATFYLAIFIVAANTVADIVVAWLDPRISRR